MEKPAQDQEKRLYQIRVKNHIDTEWERWFDGFAITHPAGGVTVFTGRVVDQSALFGLLQKLQTLNLVLLSVQVVENEPTER